MRPMKHRRSAAPAASSARLDKRAGQTSWRRRDCPGAEPASCGQGKPELPALYVVLQVEEPAENRIERGFGPPGVFASRLRAFGRRLEFPRRWRSGPGRQRLLPAFAIVGHASAPGVTAVPYPGELI